MKSKIIIFSTLLLFIIAFASAFLNAGYWLVKDDNASSADAIVILMGSISDRVLQAADLYDQNVASKVIIVGPKINEHKELEARGVSLPSNSDQARNALVAMGIPSDSITILPGYASRRTLTEAMTIREYILNNPGIDTLLIVSSAQHTRRASMIFNSAFRNYERPVYILSSPSRYTYYDAERWWSTRHGIQAVSFEYLKMANFILIDRLKLKNHEVCHNPVTDYL